MMMPFIGTTDESTASADKVDATAPKPDVAMDEVDESSSTFH
jgi:hypothetical protein